MTTTTEGRAVDAKTAMTHHLLAQRQQLPHGLNGRGPAYSVPRAEQLRKDIQQGRRDPIGVLLDILEADEADGLAMPEVCAVLRQMIAHLEARRAARGHRMIERPISALLRMETKAQARLDLAQLRLAESPTSMDAHRETLEAAAQYQGVLSEFVDATQRLQASARLQRPAHRRVAASLMVAR